MAIVQTGTTLSFPISSTAATGTVSSTITVPSDAEIVLVGVSAYHGGAGSLTSMTFTKGGADTVMTKVTGGDSSSWWSAAMFYLVLPDTGTNKTLKWSWTSTPADNNFSYSITFWKGIDTASPVRDSAGAQSNDSGFTTPTLSAQSGDKIVGFTGFFSGGGAGAGDVTTWRNLTEIAEATHQSYAEGAWAAGDVTATTIWNPSSVSGQVRGGIGANQVDSTYRVIVPVTAGGSSARVTFRNNSGSDTWAVEHAAIGIQSSGSTTTATPIELLFGGSSGFSVSGDCTTATSDWTTIPTFTTSNRLIVIMDNAHTFSGGPYGYETSSSTSVVPVTGQDQYSAAGDSYNTTTMPGGAAYYARTTYGISLIETQGAGNTAVGLAETSSWGEGGFAAVVLKPGGGTAYTLAAAVGTLTLTGQAAALRRAGKLVAANGTLTLSGQAATLKRSYAMSAGLGTLTLSGWPVNLLYSGAGSKTLLAGQGALTLAGQSVTLKRRYVMPAGLGTITMLAPAVGLISSHTTATIMPAGVGLVRLDGQPVTFRLTYRPIQCGLGTLTLTGQAVSLRYGRAVGAGVGTLTLSGQAVAWKRSYGVRAQPGVITLSGEAALTRGRKMGAAQGAMTLTGQAVLLKRGRGLGAATGVITLTGQPVNLNQLIKLHYRVQAVPGTIYLSSPWMELSRSGTAQPGRLIYGQTVVLRKW